MKGVWNLIPGEGGAARLHDWSIHPISQSQNPSALRVLGCVKSIDRLLLHYIADIILSRSLLWCLPWAT
ncbi:hypothetical protein Y032_0065g3644 [Ancylostoma ceylanicum]|uniref:Uncharacterized protein n=1 Tax=Ancylostoma ceylanicum TaxID=53326 RepID=A0A016U0K8_9BILA|nr:hypothetical protein Y032_0065g3644 [Ancylostoma ceylanicum]